MYAAIHAYPDGSSTVARMAHTAAEYGYGGIVVRNHGTDQATYDPERIASTYDIDVVACIEVRTDDPAQASGYVGNYREQRTIVAVHGGTPALNRFAVEQPAVDVLAHPLSGDHELDHVLVKTAAENGVRLEVNLRDILHQTGGTRVRTIEALQRLRRLLVEYDTPFVVSCDSRSHLELRAPRDLIGVGEQLGFDAQSIRDGLTEWATLAERNRDRMDAAYLGPGLRRVDGTDDDSS